jgi:hypothetical protein
VDTQDAPTAYGDASELSDPSRRASLRLELRVPERQMLGAFREAFLQWLTDRSGVFTRAIGASDRLTLDEEPPGADSQGMSTLRITVTCSAGPEATERQFATSFAADGEPVPAVTSLTPVDYFVFFPDPPQSGTPLFRELSVPFGPDAFQAPPRLPQLRLQESVVVAVAKDVAAALHAVQSFVLGRRRGAGIAGVTIRFPVLDRYPRASAFGLLGTAAVATGFVAGSIYLATVDRPRAEARTAAVQAAVTELAVRADPPAVIASSDLTAAILPRVVDPADRIPRSRRPESSTAAVGSTGIADTEVTTEPGLQNSARPATLRRPGIVVVRAVDVEGASSSAAASPRVRGTLLVKSDPQGAEVSINGVVHGRTPLMIRELGAGSRVLRLDLPGYERWSWAIAVVANKRTPVTVKLQPDPRGVINPD